MRYDSSEAGMRGKGNDCRLDAVLPGDVIEATDDGRDGKSCESLSDAPDVFLRLRGGREEEGGVSLAVGEPTRRAEGTACSEGLLEVTGEPVWRGDDTPSIVRIFASQSCRRYRGMVHERQES
jgi:hypothetical protein